MVNKEAIPKRQSGSIKNINASASNLFTICLLLPTLYITKNKLFLEFLWDGKPAKVKRSTIIANYYNGGLKMPDIFAVHTAAKIKWIKKLVSHESIEMKWQYLTWYLLNITKNKIKHKLPESQGNSCLTPFHKQLFDSWQNITAIPPTTIEEISNEFIFDNRYICLDNIPIQPKTLNIKGEYMYDLVIQDILDDDRTFLTRNALNDKLGINLDIFSYRKLLSIIPNTWKHIIKNTKIEITKEPRIKVINTISELTKVNNKRVYWMVVNDKIQEPTAVEKWVEQFPFLETAPWNKIFKMIHHSDYETYLQSFQYKIINRILNCNYNLHVWKIKNNPQCIYCHLQDTIEHHLFFCTDTKIFWTKLKAWINKILNTRNDKHYTICEILFGIDSNETKYPVQTRIQNLIILLGKWYINKTRNENKKIIFVEYLNLVKSKFQIYHSTSCRNVKGGVDKQVHNLMKTIYMQL